LFLGELNLLPEQLDLETRVYKKCNSGKVGDKVHFQKGNSPKYKLRPIKLSNVKEKVIRKSQLGGGLGSSHPAMKA